MKRWKRWLAIGFLALIGFAVVEDLESRIWSDIQRGDWPVVAITVILAIATVVAFRIVDERD